MNKCPLPPFPVMHLTVVPDKRHFITMHRVARNKNPYLVTKDGLDYCRRLWWRNVDLQHADVTGSSESSDSEDLEEDFEDSDGEWPYADRTLKQYTYKGASNTFTGISQQDLEKMKDNFKKVFTDDRQPNLPQLEKDMHTLLNAIFEAVNNKNTWNQLQWQTPYSNIFERTITMEAGQDRHHIFSICADGNFLHFRYVGVQELYVRA